MTTALFYILGAIMLAATLILILYLTIKWGGREAMERML